MYKMLKAVQDAEDCCQCEDLGQDLFSDAKLQSHLASEVILWLDIAQEKRKLTPREFELRKC